MRKEEEHNFDLYIKSMLEDAREDVPPRVWEAVESGLEHNSRSGIWKKRAFWSLALCAAVAAVILTMTLPHDKSAVPPRDVTTEIVAQTPCMDIQIPVSDSIDNIRHILPVIEGNQYSDVHTIPAWAQSTETTPHQEEAIEKDNTVPSKTSKEEKGQSWDEFLSSELSGKISQKRKAISFELRGGFGSNDNVSNPSAFNSTRYSSPSQFGKAATGISEEGESLYSIPISVGVGARFYITDRFSAGIGINFSSLSRSFTGTYTEANNGVAIMKVEDTDITHYMTYLGIPVNLYYDFLQNDLLYFYSFIGGTAEKGLSNKYRISSDSGNFYYSESVNGIQWSAAIGLGIQFKVSNHFGIYLDPSARYYFDCNQPKNIRTQKPLMFSVETGIRFNF